MYSKLFFAIITILLFSGNKALAQTGDLKGEKNVCPEYEYYTYRLEVPVGCNLTRLNWSIIGGSRKNGETGSTANVVWNNNNSAKSISAIYFYECNGIPSTDREEYLDITPKSVLTGTLSAPTITISGGPPPTSLGICDNETYDLTTTPVTENIGTGRVQYYWYYDNGSGWKSLGSSRTIKKTGVSLSGRSLNPNNEIKFKVEAWSVCTSNKKVSNASINYDLKYCFQDYGITTTPTDPSCHNYRDATIELKNIRNPALCVTYNAGIASHKKIGFTIARYTEMPSSGTCSANGGNGGYEAKEKIGNTWYCLSGFTANDDFNWVSNKLLTESDIELEDATTHVKKNGIPEGIYQITIENPLFSPYKFNTRLLIAPNELAFSNFETNNYFYQTDTFNIGAINGSDEINFKAVGGVGNLPYTITNLQSSQKTNGTVNRSSTVETDYSITGIRAGEYSIHLEDINDCPAPQKDFPFALTEPFPIVIDSIKHNPVSCHTENSGEHGNGSVKLFVKNGIGEYKLLGNSTTYDDENSIEPGGAYSLYAEALDPGFYNLTIEDLYGNTKDTSVEITQPPKLYYTIDSTVSPKCIGGNDGKIFLKGNGGNDFMYETADFSFPGPKTFHTGDSTVEISLPDTIQYTIQLKDSLDCIFTDAVKLAPNPDYVRLNFLDSAEITCIGDDDGWVEIGGLYGDTLPGMGYTFYIDDMETPLGTGNTFRFPGLTPEYHTLAIADTNDCMNDFITSNKDFYKRQIYVEEPDTIKIINEVQNVKVKGTNTGSIKYAISGGNKRFIYRFLDAKMNLLKEDTADNEVLIDSLYAGGYMLQVKDTCNCTNNNGDWIEYFEAEISQPEKFLDVSVVNSDTITSCFDISDGFVTIAGDGGCDDYFTYGREKNNITYNNGEFSGLAIGKHTFYVKDACGTIDSISVEITQPELLVASAASITDVSCYNESNGAIKLDVTGGTVPYYYSLDGGTKTQDTTINNLSARNYEIQVSDANGCNYLINDTVNQPLLLQVVSIAVIGALCGESDGSARAYVSGGTTPYTYQWKNDSGIIVSNTVLAENLFSGNYSLYILDAKGCDTTSTKVVDNTNGPTLFVERTEQASCSGFSDGKVYFRVENTEGVQPFSLELYYNSGSTPILVRSNQPIGNDSITALNNGEYQLKLTDANNCISVETFVISTPAPLTIELEDLSSPVCYGYTDGSISISATGGNGTYTYAWGNGSTESAITNLPAGTYAVTLSDAKGCNTQTEYELTEPELLTVSLGNDETVCEGQEYTLSPGQYKSYTWQYNGKIISNTPQISINQQGEYTVQVESQAGCLASDDFVLTVSTDLLEADFLMPSEVYVDDTVVLIDISWPEPEETYWKFDNRLIRVHSELYIEEIAFENPGVYEVQLTSVMAICIDSISKQITVKEMPQDGSEKIKLGAEESIIKEFTVYPNPNTGHFYAEIELSEKADIELRVFNLQRNSFTLIEKYYNADNYFIDYGLTNTNTGVYLLILQVKNEKKTKRILIAK